MSTWLVVILSVLFGMLMYVIIFIGLIIYIQVLDDIEIEFSNDDVNNLHEDLNGLRNLRYKYD